MERIKSQYIKNKQFFRLNDRLFQQNLPKISQKRPIGKQNLFWVKPTSQDVKNLHNKTNKVFNIPKRFIKNNNKIEENLSLFNKTSAPFHPSAIKTCHSSFHQTHQDASLKKQIKLKPKVVIKEQKHEKYLIPKTLQGIEKYFEQKYQKRLQENSRMLKEQISSYKKSSDKQISEIFQKNKHLYMLSRFTLLELKSYYSAILNFAKGDSQKFKYAFQIMLNLANITVRDSILSQTLKELVLNGITFSRFLKLFTGIQEKLRKQAIIDYFQILLQEMDKSQFKYQELLKTFQGRMKKENASELNDLLYEKLRKDQNQSITKKQIHTLCYQDEQFCNRFYTINHENMFNAKIKNHDQF